MQYSSSRIGTRRASLVLAIGAALLGVLVVFGWILGISEVKAPLPGFPAMMANTAIALILTGGAVALAGRDTLAPSLARALALGVLVIAGASLFEDVSGIALGIDQLLFIDDTSSEDLGRPAPLTSFCFLILGTASLALTLRNETHLIIAGLLALVALALETAVLVSYGLWYFQGQGLPLLFTMAPHTALRQAVLAVSLACLFLSRLPSSRPTAPRLTLASTGLVLMVVFGVWGYAGWQDYNAIRIEARQNTQNIARLLDEHIHRSLDSAELLLRRVEEQLASKDIEALANSRTEWERLRSYVEELPQVSSIGIVDAGGELRLLTTRFPVFKSNYTFRDYFKAHAEGASRYIGPLVVAGTTGKLIFTVSRRLSTADGKFAGLIMASMDVEYFRAFYRSLDLGQGASVGVFRTDGRPLVRDPLTDALIGMDLSAQPLFSRYIHERAQGTFLGRSPIDGKEKIITFRHSDDLGLVVTATASLEQVAQKFERRFLRSSAILAVVVLVVVSSSFIQIRAHRRETEAHGFTQSVLNSVATNIAILDKSGRIIEVNKPWRDFAANNGACTPDGFLGTSYFEICRAASGKEKTEAEAVANGIAAVMMDTRQAFEHQYLCHSPTEERWFKMRVTPLVGRSGAVVVSHENITDLMRVTMIDGLTGLANQRFATETLAREFIRARRHDQKLSLVLLDCADPQQISETRGRAVTNRMLMAVARVMKEVGRDTDSPARLNRGRFLMILPHTTRDSALVLSNRLEMLVSQVAMETPAGPISIPVSIGMAEITETMERADDLLAAAEAALMEDQRLRAIDDGLIRPL